MSDIDQVIAQILQPKIDAANAYKKSLQPMIDSANAYQKMFQPIIDSANAYQKMFQPTVDFANAYKSLSQPMAEVIKDYQKRSAMWIKVLDPHGENLKPLEKTGYLPHKSTPHDLITKYAEDTEKLQLELEKFYINQWKEIREDIENRIECLAIDNEAKASFKEALNIHEKGFYQAVPCLLFPTIESLVLIEFFKGSLEAKLASQTELREKIDEIPSGAVFPLGRLGTKVHDHLKEYLYGNIKEQDKLIKAMNDTVPNRHATVHGLIKYKTMQNSLNIIFMADYIFHIVDYIKVNKEYLKGELLL